MKKRYVFLLIALLSIILLSCTHYYVVKKHIRYEKQKVPKGKARVVFMRPGSYSTGFEDVGIYDGDASIGVLPPNTFFIYDAEPGKHIFGAYWMVKMDFLKADIEAGKTYYVQAILQDIYIKFFPKIVAVKKGSDIMYILDEVLAKLKHVEFTDVGRDMYKVRNAPSGKFIKVEHLSDGRGYSVQLVKSRNAWLKRAEVEPKPTLLTEDGL